MDIEEIKQRAMFEKQGVAYTDPNQLPNTARSVRRLAIVLIAWIALSEYFVVLRCYRYGFDFDQGLAFSLFVLTIIISAGLYKLKRWAFYLAVAYFVFRSIYAFSGLSGRSSFFWGTNYLIVSFFLVNRRSVFFPKPKIIKPEPAQAISSQDPNP